MSSSTKSFVFAAAMCVICSVLLTLAATSLKPFQESNERVDRQKNILKALQLLDEGKTYKKPDIESLYTENVKNMWVTPQGQLSKTEVEGSREVFLKTQGNQLIAYAIPVSGYGLWSTIYGYLGMNGDGTTIAGITFYKHGETPGLGGEVEKAWFQDQFKGKSIVDGAGKFVSVGVVKGKAADRVSSDKLRNYVDGISGATITSQGVDDFLKTDLAKYESFSQRLRQR